MKVRQKCCSSPVLPHAPGGSSIFFQWVGLQFVSSSQTNLWHRVKRRLDWISLMHAALVFRCLSAKSLQSFWTLCSSMDSSPPGSSVQGILQARLELVAISSSRGSSWLRDWTCVLLCLLHWQVGSLRLAPPLGNWLTHANGWMGGWVDEGMLLSSQTFECFLWQLWM